MKSEKSGFRPIFSAILPAETAILDLVAVMVLDQNDEVSRMKYQLGQWLFDAEKGVLLIAGQQQQLRLKLLQL